MRDWFEHHKRLLALKACIAVALVVSHYFPEHPFGLVTNLVWLIFF